MFTLRENIGQQLDSEIGQLATMSGDLSTLQLCELVKSSLGAKSSLDEVLKIWHSVGTVVKTQLKAGKGVRLQQLGLFSLTPAGKPIFAPSADLLRSYKLKARAMPSAGLRRCTCGTSRCASTRPQSCGRC